MAKFVLFLITVTLVFNLCTANPFLYNTLEEQTTTEDPKFTCLERNALSLWKVCTYTGQEHPCFWPNQYIKMKVDDISDIAVLASQLCFGRVPQSYLRRSFCCYNEECLHKCYGIAQEVQRI